MICIRFVFWNINKKDLSREIVDLCKEYQVDILIIGEHENIDENIIRSRFADLDLHYKFEYIDKQSKVIVLRKANVKCSIICDGFRYSTYKIRLINDFELLMFAVHLPSMLHKSNSEISLLSTRYKSEFESIEREKKITSSLVVGDFNMNPFAEGMVNAYAFNSVMCKSTALKETRTIDGKEIYYYYNPMWNLMGNTHKEALGTYFHHKNASSYVWNTYDQVLLRPNLIRLFDEDRIRIITSFGNHELLKPNGRPNKERYSDHLPVMFELREED